MPQLKVKAQTAFKVSFSDPNKNVNNLHLRIYNKCNALSCLTITFLIHSSKGIRIQTGSDWTWVFCQCFQWNRKIPKENLLSQIFFFSFATWKINSTISWILMDGLKRWTYNLKKWNIFMLILPGSFEQIYSLVLIYRQKSEKTWYINHIYLLHEILFTVMFNNYFKKYFRKHKDKSRA